MTRNIMRRVGFVAFMLAGVMAATVMLPASAHVSSIGHTWTHIQPKVESMLADEFLWAAVASNGALVRGSGASSAARTSTGVYTVTLGRNISTCSYTATSWDTTAGGSPVYARAETGEPNGMNPNQVRVSIIQSSTSTLIDYGFSLQVMC